MSGRKLIGVVKVCAGSVLLALGVSAADCYWTGLGGNTLLSNAANWEDGNVPQSNNDNAIFPDMGAPIAVDVDDDVTIRTIYFRNPLGTTLTLAAGKELYLNNGGALTLRADQDAVIDGPGTIRFSFNNGEDWADNQAAGGKTLTINAKITGLYGFEHNGGDGTIVLTNPNNDFQGCCTITGTGVLSVPALPVNTGVPSPIGTSGILKLRNSPGTFRYTGGSVSTDLTFSQDVNWNGEATAIEHAGTGTLTLAGPIRSGDNSKHSLVFNVVNPFATIDIAGTFYDNAGPLGLIKRGPGTLTVSSACTHTGDTRIDAGWVEVTPSGSLSAASLLRLRGGVLVFGPGISMVGEVRVESGLSSILVDSGGMLTLASLANDSGVLDIVAKGLGSTTKIMVADRMVNELFGPWATVLDCTALAAYDPLNGIIAANVTVQHLDAVGPSVIYDDANTMARITTDTGLGGGITLSADPVEILMLTQETATPATLSFTGYTLILPLVNLALNGADLTLGDFLGDGVLRSNATSDNRLYLSNKSESGARLTVQAAITDNGPDKTHLSKSGLGNVVLRGPVEHTGGTSIGEGLLTALVNPSAVLEWPDGGISGNGGFAKDGAGRLKFPNTGNTYAGPTHINEGTVEIYHNDTFGNKEAPIIVADGAAIEFVGSGNNNLNIGSQMIFAKGAGPDGNGALRNSGIGNNFDQMNATRQLTLTDNLTVYASRRLDVRNNGGPAAVNLNGYSLTKKGGAMFGLTSATVSGDQGTASIDIIEGALTCEDATTLSGGPANFVRIRDGGFFDFWNLRNPINWSLDMDNNGKVATRGGMGTNINVWAGPINLSGNAYFETLNDNGGANSDTYTGVISGPGKVIKTGNASGVTYLLNPANAWSGGTEVQGGTLYAIEPGALPGYDTTVQVFSGTLALRLSDSLGAYPGFSLAQVDALLNNGTTFQSTTASIGLDLIYEDLSYGDPFPHIGIRKFGPRTLKITNVPGLLGPISVSDGTLELPDATAYLNDRNVTVGESVGQLSTLLLQNNTSVTLFDRGGDNQLRTIIGNTGRGVLRLEDNAFINGRIIMGAINGVAGAVYQTGGTFHNTGGANNDGYIGADGYGYYLLAGGQYLNNGYSQLGRNPSGIGILHQTGGAFDFSAIYQGSYGLNRGGTGVANITGGTFNHNASIWIGDSNENNSSGGYAEFIVSGDAVVTINGRIELANRNDTTAMLTLNGGEVNAERIWRAARNNSQAFVNWNGGLFRATTGHGELFEAGGASYPDVTLYGLGAVIDIPDAGKNKAINTPLRGPEQFGLLSLPVATGGAGYLGSPFVRIEGGGGKGASAFAFVEDGEVTRIEITSPGTGYIYPPTVTLVGGGALTAATLGTPALGPVPPGGLTKIGDGTLALNAPNTYRGPTDVQVGQLTLGTPDALSPYTRVNVTGGTLDLGGNVISNANVNLTEGRLINGTLAAAIINKDGPGTFTLSVPITDGPFAAPEPEASLLPGLWEGMLRHDWNTWDPNPKTGLLPTTRAANGGVQASNNNYAGGLWRDNNHTWVYTGYLWNNEDHDVDWTFFGRFDDHMSLVIDGAMLIDTGNGADEFRTVTLSPGHHAFEARFGDGGGDVGPGPHNRSILPAIGPMSGLLVDYSGQPGATDSLDRFQILEDPGDGSLFTAGIPLDDGPGLFESFITRNSWNTLDDGFPMGRQLTTRAGNGPKASNGVFAGGLWYGNNHTWIYKGYLHNRTGSSLFWDWRFDFDDNVMLKIDGQIVRDVGLSEGVQYVFDYELTPGAHEIEIRFGDGGGDAGPGDSLGGLSYDPENRNSTWRGDYILLEDPGDGSLLTTSPDWAPPEPKPIFINTGFATINVSDGTLLLEHTAQPGLWEGLLDDSSFNTWAPNPCDCIELTPAAANGHAEENDWLPNGKFWPREATYVYTGYIWNRTGASATWTFAENFDDSIRLIIAGQTVLNDGGWDTPTHGTITLAPGPHAFELRLGQGTGGVGGGTANKNDWTGWENNVNGYGFLVDFQGRGEPVFENYEMLQDPGDGSLFTCTAIDPLSSIQPFAAMQVNLGDTAVLDLGGSAYQIGAVAGTGTVANGTLASGSVISPAGDDAVGTLTLDNVTLAGGITYRLTTDGNNSDRLISTGALDWSGITIVPATDAELTASTYVIASAPSFIGRPQVDGFPSKYKTRKSGTDYVLTSLFGTILLLR